MNILKNILVIALCLNFASCINTRPIQYVQGKFDTAQLSKIDVSEPIIQRADLINITVYSDLPSATVIYNQPNSAGGYLVDGRGNIQMQTLGELHVEGLNKQQLTDLLNSKLTEFLKNPYYTIRFINYKITVLGEVTREGVYTVPNEHVSIMEAIGLAGGLTVYAKRDNVTIVREFNGKREFARLDLTSPEIFKSPYYFLKQNDLIIVEQTRNKVSNSDQTTARNISLATTIISTLAFLYTIFRQ
jgi:polysaccharide export outer membrane protein